THPPARVPSPLLIYSTPQLFCSSFDATHSTLLPPWCLSSTIAAYRTGDTRAHPSYSPLSASELPALTTPVPPILSLLTNDGLLAQFGCELCGCPRETSLTRSTWGYGLSLRPGRSTGLRLVPHYGQWATPYGLCETLG
ncbi:unnamed protein product, partial [Rhizoctonia solani]